MTKRRYNNKHTASNGGSSQPDIADTLKRDPSLSAFTYDGPYSVTDAYDLLDSMCCVDNGRNYETLVDWKGFTRAFSQAPLHQSALYFKRNVLTGCFILTRCSPGKPSLRLRWTGLSSGMPILNAVPTAWVNRSNSSMYLR